jgi:ribosomal protein S18 acetylase RimI-like enzyme
VDAHPHPLDAARPGERWVIRTRLPDGSATDVVGWIDDLGPQAVRVAIDARSRVVVDRTSVIIARRAPAARGGVDPRRVSAEDLERHALPGWLADSEPLGEWTLRAGGGFTGRANSCLAVGDPGVPFREAADRVVAYARAHGIRPWAQVIVGSQAEAGLTALGWQPVYVRTDLLVARLAVFLGEDLSSPDVRVTDDLEPAWLAAYQRSRPNDADPGVLRAILDGKAPRAFASVGTPPYAGIARGHVSGPWLGLTSIWTAPEHRRRGLATAMMRALGHWGARHGARYVYLQVASANTAAHQAYARLGFARHHSYGYRQAPDP